MEGTSAGRCQRRRNIPAEHEARPPAPRVGTGNGSEQCFRVRVSRLREQGSFWCVLDDFSQIHHGHPMAKMGDNAQVVRDEQERQLPFVLEAFEQIDNLRPDRHIQSTDGFVGEDDFRIRGKGPSNADTLALPPGKLVREFRHGASRKADLFEQLTHTFLAFSSVSQPMNDEWLSDDGANGHARIERAVRILKNHLNTSSVGSELSLRQPAQVRTVPHVDATCLGTDQLENSSRQGRFAAATLADESQGFSFFDGKTHAPNGVKVGSLAPQPSTLDEEALAQISDPQRGIRHSPFRRLLHKTLPRRICVAHSFTDDEAGGTLSKENSAGRTRQDAKNGKRFVRSSAIVSVFSEHTLRTRFVRKRAGSIYRL